MFMPREKLHKSIEGSDWACYVKKSMNLIMNFDAVTIV